MRRSSARAERVIGYLLSNRKWSESFTCSVATSVSLRYLKATGKVPVSARGSEPDWR